MKRILLVLSFMSLINMSYAQTNVYHKFPAYVAEWKGTFGGYQSPGCYEFTYSLNYNEQYIGNLNYHVITLNKINHSFDMTGMCNFNSIPWYSSSSPGAIREDTIARKVYFLETGSTTEKLLYDFSLNVGDTVKTCITTLCMPGVVITQIDSVLINGNYRKQWTVERPGCLFNDHGKIIEGIGSTMGLLEQMVNFEWWGTLTCFSQDYINMYSIDTTICPLPIPLNANYLANKINNFIIFPNPSKNSITISQTEPTFNKYEIFSLNGKLVAESKITSNLQKVDLTGYAEGMYIVKLIGTQKVEFKKIVVVE